MYQGCGCRDNPEKVEKWGKKMMRTGTFYYGFYLCSSHTHFFDVSASSMSADGTDLSARNLRTARALLPPAADTFR